MVIRVKEDKRAWLRARADFVKIPVFQKKKHLHLQVLFGDPYGNRTHVTAVKGPCLNRLTNGPCILFRRIALVAEVGLEPTTCRV